MEEASHVADVLNIPKKLNIKRNHPNSSLSESQIPEQAVGDFKINVYLVIIDRVSAEMNSRFKSIGDICERFSFLWLYPRMKEAKKGAKLSAAYKGDISPDITVELLFLKSIHSGI